MAKRIGNWLKEEEIVTKNPYAKLVKNFQSHLTERLRFIPHKRLNAYLYFFLRIKDIRD